jgi:hypothetical protein
LESNSGECVLDALCSHLKVKGKCMVRKNLQAVFNEASLHLYKRRYKKKHGITGNMILYLCKQKNISCLGWLL